MEPYFSSFFSRSTNPFITRGDPLSPEDIASTFSIPENFFHNAQDPFHHVIEGDLGSGKTMILRAMSAAVRSTIEKSQPDEVKRMYPRQYLGVYISLSSDYTSIFRCNEENSLMKTLFVMWLNVRMAQELVAALSLFLADKKPDEWLEVEQRYLDTVLSFIGVDNGPHTVKALGDSIVILDRLANKIRNSVNVEGNVKLREDEFSLTKAVGNTVNPEEFLNTIIRESLRLTPIVSELMPCYLLLDSYEELPESLQLITNGLFLWRQQPVFFTKVCTLPNGIRTFNTIYGKKIVRPDELHETKIQWNWESNEYAVFCRSVASNHLKRFSDINKGIDIEPSPDNLFIGLSPGEELAQLIGLRGQEKINEFAKESLCVKETPDVDGIRRVLFNEIHKRGSTKCYSGLRELTILSSGNIRTFMRLCECSFDFEHKGQKPSAYRKISPRSQHQAAEQVANEYITTKIATTTSEYEEEVRHLLSSFLGYVREYHKQCPHNSVWRSLRIAEINGGDVLLPAIVQDTIDAAIRGGFLVPSTLSQFY